MRQRYRYGSYTTAENLPSLETDSDMFHIMPSGPNLLATESQLGNNHIRPILQIENEINRTSLTPYHNYYNFEIAFEELKFCYLLGFKSKDEQIVSDNFFIYRNYLEKGGE